MVRLYYDIQALQQLDIASFNVYEGDSRDGEYRFIQSVPFIPRLDFVEVNNYSDLGNWFSLTYLDSAGIESEKSEPVLAEHITDILDSVRVFLGEKDSSQPVFQDEELLAILRWAAFHHGSYRNLKEVPETEWGIIDLLIRMQCCYKLSYDTSKYHLITLPGGLSVHEGEPSQHYRLLAKDLQRTYDKLRANSRDEDGYMSNMPKVRSGTANFQSPFTSIEYTDPRFSTSVVDYPTQSTPSERLTQFIEF